MQHDQELADFMSWHAARVLRRTGRAPTAGTLKAKRSRLRSALEVSGSDGLDALSTLVADRERLEGLLDRLATRQTTGTMQATVQALRDLGEYARAMGWIDTVAIQKTDTPKSNPPKPITVYTEEEIDLMLRCARGRSLRWWMFLTTLADTGRRVGEVLGLQWDWLNLTSDVPHFNLPYTKNGKQQYVPLPKRLREEVFTPENIEALRNEERTNAARQFGRDPHVYPFPWTHSCVLRMFTRYCKSLDIEARGFHNFRHTRATSLLAKGVPIQAVSAILGHADVRTTDRVYNHATALSFGQYLD